MTFFIEEYQEVPSFGWIRKYAENSSRRELRASRMLQDLGIGTLRILWKPPCRLIISNYYIELIVSLSANYRRPGSERSPEKVAITLQYTRPDNARGC